MSAAELDDLSDDDSEGLGADEDVIRALLLAPDGEGKGR